MKLFYSSTIADIIRTYISVFQNIFYFGKLKNGDLTNFITKPSGINAILTLTNILYKKLKHVIWKIYILSS